jgi:hypothetical protein
MEFRSGRIAIRLPGTQIATTALIGDELSSMSAQPHQAAQEILAGEPQAAARRWLGPAALVMFVLFAVDTD